MIKHLREKTAIKMTTSQKYDYKTEGYKKPWDPTMSITAYYPSAMVETTPFIPLGVEPLTDQQLLNLSCQLRPSGCGVAQAVKRLGEAPEVMDRLGLVCCGDLDAPCHPVRRDHHNRAGFAEQASQRS